MLLSVSPLVLLAAAALGYLLGSMPFGVVATRLGGAGDIRQLGSGNIGATNVLRTGRKDLAALTLLGDGGKGAAAVLVARALWGHDADALAGLAAFLGHLFPVWLGFRGGKGVASFFGVLLAAAWPVGLFAAAVWIAVFAATRISSLGALTATTLSIPAAALLHQRQAVVALAAAMTVLVFIRHHQNIARLARGQEPRFGRRAEAEAASSQTPTG